MKKRTRLDLATDPTTPAEVLATLLSPPRSVVIRAVCSHPSAPRDLLLRHVGLYTDEVTSNPSWALMLLETPELIRELDTQSLEKLAAHARCPLQLLERAFAAPQPWCARLLLNAALPLARRRQLYLELQPHPEVESAIWGLDPDAIQAMLGKALCKQLVRGGHHVWSKRKYTPRLLVLPDDEVAALAKLGFLGLKLALLRPDVPAEVLTPLATDHRPLVRSWVAAQRLCPPEVLRALASDRDAEVRLAVVKNLATPSDAVLKLGRDAVSDIAWRAEGHPHSIDNEIVARVLADRTDDPAAWKEIEDHHGVCLKLAYEPSLWPALQLFLACRPWADVRTNLAYNLSLCSSALEVLLESPESTVLLALAYNRSVPEPIQNEARRRAG
jgi:hypothetical protein